MSGRSIFSISTRSIRGRQSRRTTNTCTGRGTFATATASSPLPTTSTDTDSPVRNTNVSGGATLRGSVSDPRFTSDGILANGEAGVFDVGYGDEQRRCGKMDAYTDRPAAVDSYAFALDGFHQLRTFDFDSGDRLAEATLPSEGLPLAPLAPVDRTLPVGLDPLLACDVP